MFDYQKVCCRYSNNVGLLIDKSAVELDNDSELNPNVTVMRPLTPKTSKPLPKFKGGSNLALRKMLDKEGSVNTSSEERLQEQEKLNQQVQNEMHKQLQVQELGPDHSLEQ